jgi:hypothetical protein
VNKSTLAKAGNQMPDPIYATHTPKQLKVKHDRILAIVTADPGISLDEIFKIYYSPNLTTPIAKRKGLLNLLSSLCINHQLIYIKGVNGYVCPNQNQD